MAATQPMRASVHAAVPKAKPDARPMRMALSAGGIAALSALAAAIVLPPRPAVPVIVTPEQSTPTVDPQPSPTDVQIVRPIQYVQLSPGQTAPPGATVIPATAPTPITVVVTVPAPAKAAAKAPAAGKVAAPTPIVVKTTQSGKVVP
jgi:hypothetical protein